MKLTTIRTFLTFILSYSMFFSSVEANYISIEDSPNQKMLKEEVIENSIENFEEIEIIKIEKTETVEKEKNNKDKKEEVIITTKVEDKNSKSKNTEAKINEEVKKAKDDSKRSLGTFKLTAYCGCSKCCDQYAENRPVDKNGKEIVYGSIGRVLRQGTSIAVDPNVIPYDTKVVIDNHEYIAHDTGGAIKGNKIDVYFDNHQEALNFGVKHEEVFVIND